MRNFMIVLVCLFMCQFVISQRANPYGLQTFSPNAQGSAPFAIQPTVNASPFGNMGSLYSESTTYSYENAKYEGTQFLFDKWENLGEVMVGEKKYIVPNINFNMDKQVFMSKFEDSVFVYDFSRIDKVFINGKQFRSIYNNVEGGHKVYEILYSRNESSIIKEYYITISEASPNPMLNRPNRKINQKSRYLVYRNGEFINLKLNKDDIFGLLAEDETQKLQVYAQTNKLSYKKPEDVDKMLAFIMKS